VDSTSQAGRLLGGGCESRRPTRVPQTSMGHSLGPPTNVMSEEGLGLTGVVCAFVCHTAQRPVGSYAWKMGNLRKISAIAEMFITDAKKGGPSWAEPIIEQIQTAGAASVFQRLFIVLNISASACQRAMSFLPVQSECTQLWFHLQ
jgi:hypothetical protein